MNSDPDPEDYSRRGSSCFELVDLLDAPVKLESHTRSALVGLLLGCVRNRLPFRLPLTVKVRRDRKVVIKRTLDLDESCPAVTLEELDQRLEEDANLTFFVLSC